MTYQHKFPLKVYYSDTDALGMVYHANYLDFIERARSEWLIELGYPISKIIKEFKIVFVVANLDITYTKPAKLEDELQVLSTLIEIGKASITYNQSVTTNTDDCELICEAKVKIACCDLSFKPTRIPSELQQKLRSIIL